MGDPKVGVGSDGDTMHYSVGALIRREFECGYKYLLIKRAIPPFGYSGVSGHIDKGEEPEDALVREVDEEVGLRITKYFKVLEEEVDWNWCSKGVTGHYWYLYKCDADGEPKINSPREVESVDWYSADDIIELGSGGKLEEVWEYWFKKLDMI